MDNLVRVQAIAAALEALPASRWQLVINERPAAHLLIRQIVGGRRTADALGQRDWFLLDQLAADIDRHAAAGGAA